MCSEVTAEKFDRRLALLIDADNASPGVLPGLISEVSTYGVPTVKRIYGDFTTPNLGGWKNHLLSHSIRPIQQFRYTTGKNATDSAMIIDAMDLLYGGKMDGFCLVSSDSDFTRLASRIRESGLPVYGFGERKTPTAFVSACDKFIFFDILDNPEKPQAPEERASKKVLKQDTALVNLLRASVEARADEAGWANLAGIGSHLSSQKPDFDSRNYGYSKLSSLFEATQLFEIKKEKKTAGGPSTVLVRDKRKK